MQNFDLFKSGMIVVCTDDENVESLVQKHQTYIVAEVQHRGALIKVKGVRASLASTRFIPANDIPSTPMELSNASNQ